MALPMRVQAAARVPTRATAPAVAAFLTAGVLAGAATTHAQSYIGTTQCARCHATLARKTWNDHHKGAATQLGLPAAARYAASLGGNAQSPRCRECHAPPHGPAPGVSCETCHGPGSAYKTPHQSPEFYAQADRKGMNELFDKPPPIAALCVSCHVLDPARDAAFAAAGHPTGADFDPLGKKLEKMRHWPSNDEAAGGGPLSRPRAYAAAFYASVTAAAAPRIKTRVAGLGGARPPPPGPKPSAPAGDAPTAPAPAPKPSLAPGDDPFFADSVEEYVPGSLDTSAPAPKPARRFVRTLAEDVPSGGVAAPAVQPPPPPPPVPPRPEAAPSPTSTPTAASAPVVTVPPSSAAAAPPRHPAEANGRAARLLQSLLERHAGKLALPAPGPPASFKGPDSELRRLQDEALALALEALRKEN
jgi:hypothetical protein